MIRFLALIPITLCIIWILYLKSRGYSLGQGKQGFIYILLFSVVIVMAYTLLLFITQNQ